MELPLFASRSMSAFYVDLFGPLHWLSEWQSITVGSSAEAEIFGADECVKFLLELVQILEFLDVKQLFMPSTNIVYNNNQACVNLSERSTTKGLCHIRMKENHVWENISSKFDQVCHVDGKINLADLFTKERWSFCWTSGSYDVFKFCFLILPLSSYLPFHFEEGISEVSKLHISIS